MKLYINYNFCGYRWFIIDDVLQIPNSNNIVLREWEGENVLRSVQKLMLYDSYDVILLQEDEKCILALRHIHEHNHKDPDGRKLSMVYIFEAGVEDMELLEKIMLVYITHRDYMENMLSDLISSSIDHVDYRIRSLLELLAAIKKSQKSGSVIRLGKGKIKALFSKWQNNTISSNMGLNIADFIQVKYTLEEFVGRKLITIPCIDEELTQMSSSKIIQIIKETIIDDPETLKNIFADLKALFKRQISWFDFRNKYRNELIFFCAGIGVGLLVIICF